jgi:hypothetical protein
VNDDPRQRRIALVTVVFALVGLACEGGGSAREGSTRKACDLRPDSPHVSTHRFRKTGEKVINSVVRVACDITPPSHHLTIWVEIRRDGKWVSMYSRTHDDPPPGDGRWHKYIATFEDCVPGTWRTRAKATGKTHRGVPFSFEDTSRTREVSKERCKR